MKRYPIPGPLPRLVVLSALALLTPLLAAARAAQGGGFEEPNPLQSAVYLTADQLAGDDFTVAPEATTDGFATTYSLTSRFGSWTARGRMQVALRIREIQALAQLEEVSKSEVFLDAVKSSATAPLELVQAVATQPVETLKGIPSGVGRWMRKTSFQVKEGYHDVKEVTASTSKNPGTGKEGGDKKNRTEQGKQVAKKQALDYLKISRAELAWYAKLGVDPYTDNETLRKAVTSVARVQGLTNFGMRFAGMPSIPGAREARKTMDLVWKTDPWELRLANRKKLLAAGLSEATARSFEDNPALTLSRQTALIQSLDELAGVEGRETLIARAIEVESRDEAATLTSSVALMARFHEKESPLAEFLAGTRLPVARTAKGELVALIYSDALFWTAEVAEASHAFAEVYRGQPGKTRQLWVVAGASQAFKDGAREIGWEVRDRWQSAEPEDATPPAAAAAGGAAR